MNPRAITSRHVSFGLAALIGLICQLGLASIDSSRASIFGQGAAPALVKLPEDVRSALQSNAEALSTVSIEYKVTKEGQRQPEGLLQRSYVGPYEYWESARGEHFYQKTRYEHRDLSTGEIVPETKETAFDGRVFYLGTRDSGSSRRLPLLVKYRASEEADSDSDKNQILSSPWLDAAGFHVPSSPAEWGQGAGIESMLLHAVRLGKLISVETGMRDGRDVLHVHVEMPDPLIEQVKDVDFEHNRKLLESGKNSPELIEREMAVLRKLKSLEAKRTIQFILDPSRRYCVLERQELSAEGQVILTCSCDEFESFQDGRIWLPRRCIMYQQQHPAIFYTVHAADEDRPKLTVRTELVDIAFSVPDNVQFALNYDMPGTHILDRASPEARESDRGVVTYTVSADGKIHDEMENNGLGSTARTIIWVNIALLVMIAVIFAIRRVRSR
ncbi:MAG: hypothetical protein WEB58_00465 [Planctomycetaceae bacterium]